jgi:hypothetical protein
MLVFGVARNHGIVEGETYLSEMQGGNKRKWGHIEIEV